MANVFVNLPAPAGDGVGAGQVTSTLGRERTITVQGLFGGTVIIEISCDGGVTFAEFLAFTNPGKQVVSVAANRMRVRRIGVPVSNPGLPNVDVGSVDDGGTYASLPAPAAEGAGASVNVSSLGSFKTVVVQGTFSGTVLIQISEDGTDWATCLGFTSPAGAQSGVFTAQFMRVMRVGVSLLAPGLPTVSIGGIADPGGSAPPSGPAGGDLAGTYPNPSVAAITETSGPTQLVIGAIGSGQVLIRSGGTLIGQTGAAPTGAASGQLGGTYPGPDVRGIRETGGPTLLTIGAIATGQVLARSGATLIGQTPSSALLLWGNNSVSATADTRFLSVGRSSQTAPTANNSAFRAPRAGTMQNLRVRHNDPAGNGNSVVYALNVNGVGTALTATLATGATGDASDLINTVAIVAGDLIAVTAVKALGLGAGGVEAEVVIEFV